MDIRSAARALRGDIASRNTVLCPGPGHSAKDRSLSVSFDGGEFVAYSHAGDDWKDCRDHVRQLLGWDAFAPRSPTSASPGWRSCANTKPTSRLVADASSGKLFHFNEGVERARSIWREAVPIDATPATAYLASRGVTVNSSALRWHPACPFGRERTSAMVALVRNILTNEPQAIHRTAISSEGRKLSDLGSNGRLALGPIAGGAVKLADNAEVSTVLGIGEGIETSLSIRQMADLSQIPVWSVLNAHGVASFPVLAGIEALWIAADNDKSGTGQKAARQAAERHTDANVETIVLSPASVGLDLNDRVARHA